MKVLICDDEKFITDKMEELCCEYEEKTGQELEVLAVNDFDDRGDFEADVIFLDIEMPGKTGFFIRDELERLHSESLIIFVTNYIDNVFSAFGTNVIGFFRKPLCYDEFFDLMEKTKDLLLGKAVIKIDPYTVVRIEEVRYISMDGVYSEIHLVEARKDKQRIVRKSLTEWGQILPEDIFMTVNKSFIVNCEHIEKCQGDFVVLDGAGEKISFSRRRKKDCQEKYQKYCRRMARYGR